MSLPESELRDLAAQVNALSPPDRLRLAAGLLEARRASTALPIIQRVAMELSAALLLARTDRAGEPPTPSGSGISPEEARGEPE